MKSLLSLVQDRRSLLVIHSMFFKVYLKCNLEISKLFRAFLLKRFVPQIQCNTR